MECYHCGQENNDGAVFCKNCGKRVDGKEQCPTCGQWIDCDSSFCEYCGCNLQEAIDNLEPKDGSGEEIVFVNRAARIKRKGETCCGIFAMASVFFSLLFTFFIGISFSGQTPSVINKYNTSMPNIDLYYYFGECYDQLAAFKDLDLPDFVISHYYFYCIFGTLLSIAILAVSVSLAITALVKYAYFVKGKSDNSYFKYALMTYIVYVLGFTLFCAYNGGCGQTTDTVVTFSPNFYSTIGIALSTLCIIPAVIGKVSTLGNQFSAQQNVKKVCFAVLSIIILAFLAILTATPAVSLLSKENDSVSCNFFSTLWLVVTLFMTKEPIVSPATGMIKNPEPPVELYTNFVIALLLQTAIIITILLLIAKHCNSLSSDKQERTFARIGSSTALFLMSIVYLILTITAENQLIEYMEIENNKISTNVISFVLIALISLVYLVVSVFNAIANRRIRK